MEQTHKTDSGGNLFVHHLGDRIYVEQIQQGQWRKVFDHEDTIVVENWLKVRGYCRYRASHTDTTNDDHRLCGMYRRS